MIAAINNAYLTRLAYQSRDVWLRHNAGQYRKSSRIYREAVAEVESRIEYVLSLYEREMIPEYEAAYALAQIMTEKEDDSVGEPYCPYCGSHLEEED